MISAKTLTQEELDCPQISPDQVLKFNGPTDGFLCSLSSNRYGIEFKSFTIRDMESGRMLFQVNKGDAAPPDMVDETATRTIQYDFPADFLKLDTVGTKLVFSVGPRPVPNFRMIERHYFRDKLLKSFDFNFGFCIPNSTNSWEAIYDMPKLTPEEQEDLMKHPFETKSDSFYFVNNELIMHNKADYSYQS
ncbi:Protein unc-119 [Diplonema papillatum]|nr:Protein unc-119 [Diplonema papillatum]